MSEDKTNRYVALGARLKFLREQWQQSLRDVCNTLEIDEKTLQAIEAGKLAPLIEVLDMFINHFLLTEDQAQDLRDLADIRDDSSADQVSGVLEDMLSKQVVMFMPIDNRIVYTDSMQATVNETGVILQFMQQNGNGQSTPISRVGMSREHAERVLQVLESTLKHYKPSPQKQLPSPPEEGKTES